MNNRVEYLPNEDRKMDKVGTKWVKKFNRSICFRVHNRFARRWKVNVIERSHNWEKKKKKKITCSKVNRSRGTWPTKFHSRFDFASCVNKCSNVRALVDTRTPVNRNFVWLRFHLNVISLTCDLSSVNA